jgi:hypothetical protein
LRTNIGTKLLLNQKNYIIKNKKITDSEIDEIKKEKDIIRRIIQGTI